MEPSDMTYEDLEPSELDGIEELSPEEQQENEEQEKREEEKRKDALIDLAQKIATKFEQRAANRQSKELEWIDCMRLYLGSLSGSGARVTSDKPFGTIKSTRRPDVNVISTKCDIAISQCVSQQFATGEKNWDMWPAANETSVENAQKASGMEKEIETQLDKCHYGYECRQAITDRITMGSGILKGPVNTGKVCKEYAPLPSDPNVWMPTVSVAYYPEVMRVNPWFFFPDDSTNDFNKVEDSIEIHPMSRMELSKYKKHDGFIADALDRVLKEAPKDYVNSNLTTYANLTDNSNPYLFKNKYCVLEYHGPISADEMDLLNLEPSYDSPSEDYYGEVWVVDGEVIRIELENIEASFEIPYAMSTFKKDPSSVFGFGMPLTMADAQRVATQSWRMILDNASLSSGPQVGMQKRFIQPADGIWEIEPRKVWNLTDPMMKVSDAIQFFDVPNVTQYLLPVLQLAREFAQEESNTPLLAAGMSSGDTQESATGALIMKQSSTVLLDFLAEDWDDMVTQKVITRMYGWNMQYNPKPEIKGNYVIDVRSSTEYKNKQMHVRDIERLSMEAAQNPEMAKQLDMGALTRLRLEMMHLPNRTIIRTPEQVAQYEAEMAKQPDPKMMELQLKAQEVQQAGQELELKKAELAFQLKQQQQREQWEHEEKMAANYARTVESQAMVLRSQNDKETEMIKMASHAKTESEKLQVMAGIQRESNDTTLFLKSMEETRKARESLLTERELELKAKTGSGI